MAQFEEFIDENYRHLRTISKLTRRFEDRKRCNCGSEKINSLGGAKKVPLKLGTGQEHKNNLE